MSRFAALVRKLLRRPAPAASAASEEPRDDDDLHAAFHVDDPFREPRQADQLQRLITRYEQQQRERTTPHR